MSKTVQENFSADVSLQLIVDGKQIDVSKVGPDTIRLPHPVEGLAGKAATLVIRIGSAQKIQPIVLSEPIAGDPKKIGYW